jgi:hypothetical protein
MPDLGHLLGLLQHAETFLLELLLRQRRVGADIERLGQLTDGGLDDVPRRPS